MSQAAQMELLRKQQEFMRNVMTGFANYEVYSHLANEKQQSNADGMPFHPNQGFEYGPTELVAKGKRDKYTQEEQLYISQQLSACPMSNEVPKYHTQRININFQTDKQPKRARLLRPQNRNTTPNFR